MTTQSLETPISYSQLLRSNRNFRWLWSGQIVSLLGDWFNLIASAALLAQLTESGLAIGGLFVIRMLAPFITSPIAGVVADRYNRKAILMATDIIRGITVVGFLFIRRPEDVWIIYALTAIQLGTGSFFFTTRNAILPDIVKPNEIGTANTILSITWSTMLAVGAALGGLVAGFWGIAPAFIIDALTFAVSAFLLWQMAYTPPKEQATSDKSIAAAFTQYAEGIKYLKERLDQLLITLLKGANALLISAGFQIMQVTLAESTYSIGEGGGISMGLFFGIAGIGTGVGPLIARRITGDDDGKMRWAIVIGWLISGVGMWTVSTLGAFWLVLFGTFLRGFGGGIIWVFSTQLLLQLVPGEVRGRIFATEYMIFTLLGALGSAIVGWALDGAISIQWMMRIMGTSILVPAVLWTIWTLNRSEPDKVKEAV